MSERERADSAPNGEGWLIRGGSVVLPDRIMERGAIAVSRGRITGLFERHEIPRDGYREIDASGMLVVPGFVELHIHGAGRWGFEYDEADVVESIARHLHEQGVTTFVPTLQCDLAAIERVAAAIARAPGLAERVPGLYVEGPFVSEVRRGGIFPRTLRAPDLACLDEVIAASRRLLRLMTVAPELPGSGSIIEALRARGVIPCLGHSDCTLAEVPDLGGGVYNITHLFNGMSAISHKRSGLAMLPFLDSRPYVEVNGDGVHLNDETIRLCYRHLNHERIVLISDATISAGLGPGRYRYFDRPVDASENGVRYEDGTLIGASCLLPEIVRRFVRATGAPVHTAVRLATLNPCRLLGIDGDRGSIAVGRRADLLLLDNELRMVENLSDRLRA